MQDKDSFSERPPSSSGEIPSPLFIEQNPPRSSGKHVPSYSLAIKFIECAFVALAISIGFDAMIGMILLSSIPASRPLIMGISVLLKIAAGIFTLVYPLYWQKRESAARRPASTALPFDSALRHAWFQALIRYWLAVDICNYGFAKILHTQFEHLYFHDDSLWRSLSGYALTWSYFEYSYAFSVIIAVLQIGGSILLLFRRTTLLGVTVLLPVMVNIALIDTFYGIRQGAILNVVLFTLALTYLLLLHWSDLKALFLSKVSSLPPIKLGWTKSLFRLSAVAYAFFFIWHFASYKYPERASGRFKVESMVRNGQPVDANAWLTDSLAWKTIYLETNHQVYVSPNPYVYEYARS